MTEPEQNNAFKRPRLSSPQSSVRSQSSSDTDSCSDQPSTSEGSNTDKAAVRPDRDPTFKILAVKGHGKWLEIKGIQNTELIDGEPQPPIHVCPITESRYKPGKRFPAVREKQIYWTEVGKLLDDVLGKKNMKYECGRWISQRELAENDQNLALDMHKKYPQLPPRIIKLAFFIRNGFLGPSQGLPLGNALGRTALSAMFELCEEAIDISSGYFSIATGNIGGGARGYPGSCSLVTFKGNQNLTEAAAMEKLAASKIPKKKVGTVKRPCATTLVPDGQLYAFGHMLDVFNLTAEVESSDTNDKDSICQTWKQALIGLTKLDTTYGVLLRPSQGKLLELCVLQPNEDQIYRNLVTNEKTWSFLDAPNSVSFDVGNFVQFMEAIIDIMLKSSKPLQSTNDLV